MQFSKQKYKDNNINILNKKLLSLELDAKQLKRIRLITNECLSNGAYSQKNIEVQLNKLDALNIPEWEKKILEKAWEVKKMLAHDLFKKLERVLDGIKEGEYRKD